MPYDMGCGGWSHNGATAAPLHGSRTCASRKSAAISVISAFGGGTTIALSAPAEVARTANDAAGKVFNRAEDMATACENPAPAP
jgi:hypothetical protein